MQKAEGRRQKAKVCPDGFGIKAHPWHPRHPWSVWSAVLESRQSGESSLGLAQACQTPSTPKPHLLHPNFPANVSGMSTAAEIQAAIRQLPAAEARTVAQWLQEWHI
jgi:hypothetical protein